MATLVRDRSSQSGREFLETHPWISYTCDLRGINPRFWEMLGEARSRCRHLALTPLKPDDAATLHQLYLAKGVHATTAIEGNSLTEEQVRLAVQGDLELPPSQQYLGREVDNILRPCNAIMYDGFMLSVDVLKDLNRQVLDGLDVADHVVPGEFRDVSVVAGPYRGAPARDVEFVTTLLVDWLNGSDFAAGEDKREQFVKAFLKAVVAHLYIAWIHPFGDGNGRTARLVEFGILTAAGVPSAAAHLLSNHYNLTRSAYYRELQHAGKPGGDIRQLLHYAIEGFVDQLQQQLDYVHTRTLATAWENYVHERFEHRHSPTAKRQRDLALALSHVDEPVPRGELRRLTPELAEAYAGKQGKTVTRDINILLDLGLVERTGGGVRAKKELMFSFLPRVHTPSRHC